MKISKKNAIVLKKLLDGEILPYSKLKKSLAEELVFEGILHETGKIQKRISLINKEIFIIYLKSQYQINNLEKYIEMLSKNEITRADQVIVSGDSKIRSVRTFKGFLVNSYQPVKSILNDQEYVIEPQKGTFQFIFDFENFIPDSDITIIGIENPENFRYIEKQKYLFKEFKPLFVSRYPQNQSKDLIKWLQMIPNNYLHFGDFDFAGINIYLHEYKKHLQERSTFFIPSNMDKHLKNGSFDRYNKQKCNFDLADIYEERLKILISLIHECKKGLDQEYFI